MIILTEPDGRYLPSYREAFAQYRDQGVSTYGMTDPDGCDIFRKYENYRWERDLKPDRVGCHYFWLVDDARDYFIGEIAVRHRLNDALFLRGGHIGYVVRWDQWNRGWGTLMLQLALERAGEMGLKRVLLTCNDSNPASARVMEKNGCVLENIIEVDGFPTRRYWKTLG